MHAYLTGVSGCCTPSVCSFCVLLLCVLQLPDDVQDISTPMLFICAEQDAQFPEKVRTGVQQVLEEKSPGELLQHGRASAVGGTGALCDASGLGRSRYGVLS